MTDGWWALVKIFVPSLAASFQRGNVPSPPSSKETRRLASEVRLMKIVVANMVLKNANLTNEVLVLRRLLSHYELATTQDLMALMNWFVSQLNVPLRQITTMDQLGTLEIQPWNSKHQYPLKRNALWNQTEGSLDSFSRFHFTAMLFHTFSISLAIPSWQTEMVPLWPFP